MTSPGDCSFAIARQPRGVVVTVRGRLDLADAARLGAVLGDLIEGQGNATLGVDLGGLTGVDPAGLGVFAVAAKLAEHHGGELTLTPPSASSSPMLATAAPGAHARKHLVEFYDTDGALAESVADHVVPGLQADDAVLAVAAERHRYLFEAAVTGAGVDVVTARQERRYVDLDAGETLSQFVVDGMPDSLRFAASVGRLVAGLASTGRAVRIYGEMVAVLWAEGNVAAAIALEDLWNELATLQAFSLLCAYPVTAFDAAETTGSFRAVCEQHALVA